MNAAKQRKSSRSGAGPDTMLHFSPLCRYPDVIESCPPPGSGQKHSHTIKSHHNVGGLPKDLQFTLIEPFRELFKDEVRGLLPVCLGGCYRMRCEACSLWCLGCCLRRRCEACCPWLGAYVLGPVAI